MSNHAALIFIASTLVADDIDAIPTATFARLIADVQAALPDRKAVSALIAPYRTDAYGEA